MHVFDLHSFVRSGLLHESQVSGLGLLARIRDGIFVHFKLILREGAFVILHLKQNENNYLCPNGLSKNNLIQYVIFWQILLLLQKKGYVFMCSMNFETHTKKCLITFCSIIIGIIVSKWVVHDDRTRRQRKKTHFHARLRFSGNK